MTSAYAVWNSSYELRTPYISTTEYINAPTAMDVNNLIAGGNPAVQLSALQETIGRASSWIDQYCCGFSGTLCATLETENARIWGSYRNSLIVKTLFWPIVEVDAFAYTPIPGGLAGTGYSASVNPSESVTIYPQQFEVAMNSGTQFWGGASGFGGFGTTGVVFRQEYDCQWNYVAGWPNTSLAASVAAGSTQIQVTDATGIYPLTMLTLYDMPNDEAIQVAADYQIGSTTIPFAIPLSYSHNAATVTNLPPAIKQAAILATTAFIKQRGSGAMVVSDMGTALHQSSGFSQNSGSDWWQAEELLLPFKQSWVGY